MTKPRKKTGVKPKELKKTSPPVSETGGKRKTKSAAVLDLLNSRNGATIAEMVASTGWQNHSLRGFLSGIVKKKMGCKIITEVIGGDRRYRIGG